MASDFCLVFCFLEIGDEYKSHLAVEAYGLSELEVVETVTAWERTVEVLGNDSDMMSHRDGRTDWDSRSGDRWDDRMGPFGNKGELDGHTRLHFSSARKVLLDQTSDVVEDAEIDRRVSFCFLFWIYRCARRNGFCQARRESKTVASKHHALLEFEASFRS